ncbi:TPR domain protein in aerotolerance operon [Pseudomonas marincola]|uniref:VWFA domain-containing protein n=1 Tax=Pseudomonas marincola TaxID=437900 RepID=A0A653E4R0_9PSED|nr:VWA domain-containing protein [Pseudomonas marincola]CAE6898008.1 TPR domain protein in aerotolerance operon [Pseudomonas marincola]
MTYFLESLSYFHFLRPWWLLLLVPLLWIWWRMRPTRKDTDDVTAVIAPHLAEAITVGGNRRQRWTAADSLGLAGVLLALAVAGPAWNKIPNPLLAQTAPLAMVLAVTPSMDNSDIAPSRLERARQKLLELSALRSGARTSLIAYAGTAHRVVPLTEDPHVLKPFIEGLNTDVMPKPGNNASAALALAEKSLESETVPGAIVFLLDDLNNADVPAFEKHAQAKGARLIFLTVGSNQASVDRMSGITDAEVVELSVDDQDVKAIERYTAQAYREALSGDDRLQWRDQGVLFAWPAALLILLSFRRGRVVQWPGAAALVLLMSLHPGDAQAANLVDFVLTPDQQGRLQFDQLHYAEAGEKFQDPLWKGYALYMAGSYAESAEVLNRLETSQAAFIQGMAQTKALNYRAGIEAFKLALERDPKNQAAARNLDIARALLAYAEDARDASDTGIGSEGADEVVYDKESAEGADMLASDIPTDEIKMQSTEQWMRSVDTRTSEYLKQRFLLESIEDQP